MVASAADDAQIRVQGLVRPARHRRLQGLPRTGRTVRIRDESSFCRVTGHQRGCSACTRVRRPAMTTRETYASHQARDGALADEMDVTTERAISAVDG
jgi:hypothetical protein